MKNTVPKLRILLAEDHATVREGLRMILAAQRDMEVVGEVGDGRTAVTAARALSPDIIVMDVSMPEMNGMKATEAIREQVPDARILVLTRHAEPGYLRQLLRAGASGYVLKQSLPADLLTAIRAIAAGGNYIDPAIAGQITQEIRDRRTPLPTRSEIDGLTPREIQVLRLMAAGYSNKEIAARLDVGVKTVETHKANAMQKLGLKSRIDVVRFAMLHNWLDSM